ncbi:MAG: trypsin-like peptidase domain-containing protein [Candidatus Coatesbacteria bacterium]|nr:MAG: trypsin-like peptidase domain-containing protein [Candidatus Coatesbacteria bacterium]
MKLPRRLRGAAAIVALAAALPLSGCAQPSDETPAGLKDPVAEVTAAVEASRSTALVTASANCSPAVVTVNTVQTIRRRVFNPFYSPLWQDFFRDFMGPPYQEFEEEIPSMGSGFLFDPEGYIFTAEHVVHGADKIEVTLPDNRTFPATWVGSDYEHDIAVLKIEGEDLPHVELGDSSNLMIGEWAIAIGNPFGHVVESTSPTVSVGVISALRRQMKNSGQGGLRFYDDLVQTDASINPGNSGGPLVDALGRAIGVNCTIITTSGGSLGIGFAVPINVARESARRLLAEESSAAWIGVYPLEVTPNVATALALPDERGLLIGDIDENAPAAYARLARGDVILEVNGRAVDDVPSYEKTLRGAKVGDTLNLKVRRGGRIMEGKVQTETRPGP